MSYTSLLWGYVESNTSGLTSMDRNECISASVLMMVNLVVTFHERCFMEIAWDWTHNCGGIGFFAQVGAMGKTDLGNLYLIYCPLTETSDQCSVY